MNPQATELNDIIKELNPTAFELLSEKGKNAFFPKKGILGQTAQAKGKKINATIGSAVEDDGSPMRLNCIEKNVNMSPAQTFPYAPSFGKPDIREKWQQMIYEKNPSLQGKRISLPVVTNALTHGLSMIAHMFMNEGENVIVSDLFWGNYNLIFTGAFNVGIEKFTLFKGEGFDLDSFEAKINEGEIGKKLVLLNFPNNPTGYTPTTEEMQSIVAIIKTSAEKGNKLLIICDDAYFGLVYENGIERQSIFAFLADIHENVLSVKADGPTKEDYVWGFRTGFLTYATKGGSEELYTALNSKTAGAIRGNISNACNLSQSLLFEAFKSSTYQDEKIEKYHMLKIRYQKIKESVYDAKYDEFFKALPFNSGYFMCVRLNDGLDAEDIRQILLKDYDTGVIAMNDVLRLAFSAVSEELIPEMFENIYNACKQYSESK